MTLIIENNDIMSEVLRYVSYTSIVKTSMISKCSYNIVLNYYNNISFAEKEMLKYEELDESIIKYCSATIEKTCDKYKYKKPKFIRHFNNFLVWEICPLLLKKFIESRNLYVLGDMLIIKTHLINHNYNAILQKFEEIDYLSVKKVRSPIDFILQIVNSSSKKRWGRCYSEKIVKMMNIICHLFFYKLVESTAEKNTTIGKILVVKKKEWISYIDENAKGYPKYFLEKLKKIL